MHLELWGFASTMVFAITGQTWPNLLLLQPTRKGLILPAFICWAIGSLGTPLAWLLFPETPMLRVLAAGSQLAGAVLYTYALRLFERPARAATLMLVVEPPRAWLRVAFAFLLVGAALYLVAALGAELWAQRFPWCGSPPRATRWPRGSSFPSWCSWRRGSSPGAFGR